MSDGKQDLSANIILCKYKSISLAGKSYLILDNSRKEIAAMKMIILFSVFLASATGMSEATEPLRTYYRNTYGSGAATIAMIAGIILGS